MQDLPIPDTRQLCGDFVNYIEQVRGFAPATVRTYVYVLESFMRLLGDCDVRGLTLQQLDDYIALFSEERHLKPSSTNTVRCVLRAFFLYCDKYRQIRLRFDYSMIRQIKAPRPQVDFVTLDEAKLIIRNLKTPQDKLMYTTMFAAALRIGEVVKIQVEDFRPDELRIRGKGGKHRTVPIDTALSQALQAHIYANRLLTGPLFRHQAQKSTDKTEQYTVSGLRKRWQRQLGPIDLYKKPHAARHGMATELLYDGMDIRTLQTYLGHSNIQTTMLYTHVTDSHLKQSYQEHFPSDRFNALELTNM